jgi:hypothetical protein
MEIGSNSGVQNVSVKRELVEDVKWDDRPQGLWLSEAEMA